MREDLKELEELEADLVEQIERTENIFNKRDKLVTLERVRWLKDEIKSSKRLNLITYSMITLVIVAQYLILHFHELYFHGGQ